MSSLVFGDRKAAYLLPWKRICDMSEATVGRAITDNARVLLKSQLASRGQGMQVRMPPAHVMHASCSYMYSYCHHDSVLKTGSCIQKCLTWRVFDLAAGMQAPCETAGLADALVVLCTFLSCLLVVASFLLERWTWPNVVIIS